MAAFHVFVDGATDASPAGLSRLAEAIAKHYGLPAADLHARLQKGRFRVKGNIDRATADQYASDLNKLGARCTIEEATAENSQRATPLPFPAVRPGTPAPVLPAAAARAPTPSPLGGPQQARASTPPPLGGPQQPRASTPPPVGGQQFQSGLSAAFSGEMPAASLGALEGDNNSFALSSVDGADGSDAAPESFEPPGGDNFAASIGPAPEKAKPATPQKPKDEPLDMFAPPDAQGEEFQVNIAADEIEVSARKRASTPMPFEAEPAPSSSQPLPRAASQPAATQPTRKSQPSLQAPNAPVDIVAPSSSKLGPLAEPRVRMVAGVVLAIVLGFAPAHVVAGMREDSAYQAIDSKVIATQQLAETPAMHAQLDRMRADQLARKESERRNAAIIAFAIWALVGGAIGFVWFRKIPWDRYE